MSAPVAAKATVPYRPSNGTEGECFMDDWCQNCARDRALNGEGDWDDEGGWCPIIAKTFVYDVNDKEYPVEWIKDAGEWPGNPRCTAFIPVGEPVPPAPGGYTLPLFP